MEDSDFGPADTTVISNGLPYGITSDYPHSKRIHWRMSIRQSDWKLLDELESTYAIDLWLYLENIWRIEPTYRLPKFSNVGFNHAVLEEIGSPFGRADNTQYSNVTNLDSLLIINVWKKVVKFMTKSDNGIHDKEFYGIDFNLDTSSWTKAIKSTMLYLAIEKGYLFSKYPNAIKIFNIRTFP